MSNENDNSTTTQIANSSVINCSFTTDIQNESIIFFSNSDLYFLVQNIRSMRKNFDQFLPHLATLSSDPSMIFLTEIWVYENELSDFEIPNYVFHANCNNEYRSGGVGVFLHKDVDFVSFEPLKFKTMDALKLIVKIKSDVYCIICIYRFNWENVQEFLTELGSVLFTIKNKNLFVIGDLNIDLLKQSSLIDEYISLMASFGLDCLVSEPTRVVNEQSSCIDHVFVRLKNSYSKRIDYSVQHLQISDHALLSVGTTSVDRTPPNNKHEKSKILTVVDFKKLNQLLLYEFWEPVSVETNPSVAFEIFISILMDHIKICTNTHRKKAVVKLKPWISESLLRKINTKKKLLRKSKKHPNSIHLKTSAQQFSKMLNVEISKTKENFYIGKFAQNKNDSKKNWTLINELLGKQKETTALDRITIGNECVTDQAQMADAFNRFFINVPNNMGNANDSFTIPNVTGNLQDIPFQQQSFFFEPFMPSEVLKAIDSLDNKYSNDIFGMNNVLLKQIKYNIVNILTILFNSCVANGIFPDVLKQSLIVPLYKKNDKQNMSNYRPISLCPVVSKLFEKLVKPRFISYLERNHLLSNSQFGFRCGKNTEDALEDLLSFIDSSLDGKYYVGALFIDISKAFDTVNHELLLNKLYRYGFRGFFHKWLCSYLSNRRQCVKIGDTVSQPGHISCGVPQGSVLGPLLFLIYCNSIFYQNFNAKITAFADDMVLAYKCRNKEDMASLIESDLDILKDWFAEHHLIMSDKSRFMSFSLSDRRAFIYEPIFHSISCSANGCTNKCIVIEQVNTFKYLGITLDSKLNWQAHINGLKSYSWFLVKKFYMLKNICPISLLRSIYFALGSSRLQYGIVVWGGAYQATFKPLFIIQKYIVKIIYNQSRLSSSWRIFVSEKILPLRHLYVYKILKLFFHRSGNRNIRFVNSHNIRRNHEHKVSIPKHSTEHHSRFFSISAPSIFNSLPVHIRTQMNINKFLKDVKLWLFSTENVEQLL